MRPTNFFRAALALPIVLPLVGGAAGYRGFLTWTLLIGGVPYLFLVMVLLVVSYRATSKRFLTLVRFSPFLMAAMFGPVGGGAMFFTGGFSNWGFTGFFNAWFVLGLYSLLVGYAYLALVGCVYLVLEKLKLTEVESWLSGDQVVP